MTRRPIARRRLTVALAGCTAAVALGTLCWGASDATDPVPATATGQRAPAAQTPSALIPSGDVPDLFLLYTGDVIGYIDPCG